jgi:hypothetical protein
MTRAAIAIRNMQLDAATSRVSRGTLRLYTGEQPAAPEHPAAGTLLAVLTLPAPAFKLAYGGTAEALPISPAYAVGKGMAGCFRLFSYDGSALYDGAVSNLQGTGELRLKDTVINAGDQVVVSSLTLALPA